MSNELKELVEKYSNQARIASQHDKVYKDECVYSYTLPSASATPSPGSDRQARD
jgi:hypothetical protein